MCVLCVRCRRQVWYWRRWLSDDSNDEVRLASWLDKWFDSGTQTCWAKGSRFDVEVSSYRFINQCRCTATGFDSEQPAGFERSGHLASFATLVVCLGPHASKMAAHDAMQREMAMNIVLHNISSENSHSDAKHGSKKFERQWCTNYGITCMASHRKNEKKNDRWRARSADLQCVRLTW